MINTNRITPDRGIEVMTNYQYSDTFYRQIKEEESHWFYPSFPQINTHSCGKSIFNGEKR